MIYRAVFISPGVHRRGTLATFPIITFSHSILTRFAIEFWTSQPMEPIEIAIQDPIEQSATRLVNELSSTAALLMREQPD